jgi:hypothetical protein
MEPRLWSHDALQRAQLAVSLRQDRDTRPAFAALERAAGPYKAGDADAERNVLDARAQVDLLEDLEVTPSVLIPQPNGDLVDYLAPDRSELAAWLYPGAPLVSEEVRTSVLGQQATEVDELLRCLLVWHRPARYARLDAEKARDLREQIGNKLQLVLVRGLESRLGKQLHGPEESVYVYLAARGVKAPELRVCECCLLTFRGRRAAKCESCRHSPVRPQLRPWHREVYVADRAATTRGQIDVVPNGDGVGTLNIAIVESRAARATTYVVECVGQSDECEGTFETTDARQQYCAVCRTPRMRTQRSRQRRLHGRSTIAKRGSHQPQEGEGPTAR